MSTSTPALTWHPPIERWFFLSDRIIYTLFLGFSIAIGSDVFYLFDPSSRKIASDQNLSIMTLDGTFVANNVSQSFEGSFSFTNQTQTIVSQTTASLQKGSIMCYRDPSWQWWRQGCVFRSRAALV